MRRKSGRSGKISPEKTGSDSPKKLRRQSSRRRKRSSSRSSVDSNDGKSNIKEPVQDGADNNPSEDNETSNVSRNNEECLPSPTKGSKVKSSGDNENPERKSLRRRSSLNQNINEDSQEQEGTEEREEKKTKGKSKGKNKSNIEQSSNIIEPEIEHENVQGTPQSPSNDNADNENVQNVNDTAKIDVENQDENKTEDKGSESVENTQQSGANFESEYTQENADNGNQQKEESDIKPREKEDANEESKEESSSERPHEESKASPRRKSLSDKGDLTRSSSKRSGKEERSLTPEIKGNTSQKPKSTHEDHNSRRKSSDQSGQEKSECRENSSSKKKITLRRSPPQNNETYKSEEASLGKERRSITEESGKEAEDQEEKPRKKIMLKRTNVDERVSTGEKVEEKVQEEPTRLSSANEEFGEKKRRLSSLCEDKGHDGEEKPKKILKKIKLMRSLSRGNDGSPEEKTKLLSTQRRKCWSRADWIDKLSFYKVDVDSIKIVCPSVAFLAEDEVHLEAVPRERRKSESELKRKISMDKSDDDRPDYDKQMSEDSSGEQKIEPINPNIIAMNRKISIVDDTASKLRPPPSPAKHPTSDVLYISNLVRPFTVKQLKELLERTGKIKEDGFWTDRIKSKCYVHYESVEEAEATRNALHGVHWPIGNGKQLVIDYATVEDLEKAKNPAPPPKPIVDTVPEKENREPVKVEEKHKERERERDREKEERKRRDGPVREWDLGKEESRRAHSRSRSRSRERVRKHSRRSYTPEDYMHRKQRKVEEPVPQKLMDDLFLKTKATPSIYWQPLTAEEIATKQKQRLVRMEEHKRRIEETRVRLRDTRRGSFRRR